MCLPRLCPSAVSMPQCPQSPHFAVHSFTVDQGTCVFSYWAELPPCSVQLLVTRRTTAVPHVAFSHNSPRCQRLLLKHCFQTPYASAGSLAIMDLLSEHMVALTCIETQHVHTDKFYVLFLNWSCQSCCSRRNQKEWNTPLIFIWITFVGLYIYIYKSRLWVLYTHATLSNTHGLVHH